MNAVVVGVSPDSANVLQRFRARNNLNFTLLSDPDHKVAELYGVWREKRRGGKTSMGIARSHFVIDEEGKVVNTQISVTPEQSVERALQKVRELSQAEIGPSRS